MASLRAKKDHGAFTELQVFYFTKAGTWIFFFLKTWIIRRGMEIDDTEDQMKRILYMQY